MRYWRTHRLFNLAFIAIFGSILFLVWLYSQRSANGGAAGSYCLAFSDAFWWTCMGLSEWASWAQAVGGIAAICAAISIATNEARERRKDALVRAHSIRPNAYLHLTGAIESIELTITAARAIRTDFRSNVKSTSQFPGGPPKPKLEQMLENIAAKKSERLEAYEYAKSVPFPPAQDTAVMAPFGDYAELVSNGQLTVIKCQRRLKALLEGATQTVANASPSEDEQIVQELEYAKSCFEKARSLCEVRT